MYARAVRLRRADGAAGAAPWASLGDALGWSAGGERAAPPRERGRPRATSVEAARSRLEALGARVYGVSEARSADGARERWTDLAGCEEVKLAIEENLLLPLQQPAVYRDVLDGTRAKHQPAHASAFLFEGPPGTGKTSAARILAGELQRPLVHLPLEAVVSKWYGEAEQRLSSVFEECKALGPTVLFIDEIDALAGSRGGGGGGGVHEATRRSLAVLLRALEGFESGGDTVLIAATNRPQDLDAALLSRFSLSVHFPLPPLPQRAAIFKLYAKQLSASDIARLAAQAEGASGRDIRDVCEASARKWAARRVRNEPPTAAQPLPPLSEYEDALRLRREAGRRHGSLPAAGG